MTTTFSLVDGLVLSEDDYYNHVMALQASDDKNSDHDLAEICLKDLSKAVKQVVSFTDDSLKGIKQSIKTISSSLTSIDSIQAMLNKFWAEMQPVIA